MAEAQGCDTPESHQFDFWVGHWQVFPTAQPQHHVADSLIEKLYDGCAIRENWKPLKAGDGGSLSSYLPDLKQWRQSWIDVTGQWVDYRGAWNGTAMVLTGATPQPGHPNQITRMTYTVQADGAVRQLGEVSDDQGKTWSPGFDFLYRKAA
jgi:hypothetical protein